MSDEDHCRMDLGASIGVLGTDITFLVFDFLEYQMTTLHEAAQKALEALELAHRSHGTMLLSDPPQEAWKANRVDCVLFNAIEALKAALAQQVEIPPEGSERAEALIQSMLKEYDYPANPTNAARAGYRAARLAGAAQEHADALRKINCQEVGKC